MACRSGEFWIQCDFCDTWYDGKCVQVSSFLLSLGGKHYLSVLGISCVEWCVAVQMTPGKAQKQGKWKCPACERRMG